MGTVQRQVPTTLLGIALLLFTCPVISTRARRRHHSPNTRAETCLHREASTIPGVSIWTSRTAARDMERGPVVGGDRLERRANQHYEISRIRTSRISDGFQDQGHDQACCDDGVRDADVEPPPRQREGQEGISEEEDAFPGMLASEEEEDEPGNGDAPPGRLLEEGGGSDSQEDETDHDNTTDDGDDSDEPDSFEDDSTSGEALSDEDDREVGSGARGLLRRRDFAASSAGEGRGWSSRAQKYEDDEEACFARLKELWAEQMVEPLSSDDVAEISGGVRAEQKKLLEAAPTEWNPGLGRGGVGQTREGGQLESSDVDDDSSHGLLYRLLLAELHGDGASGGLNNRWIDRDVLLQLRGAATLAHHPEYLRYTNHLPSVSRGVRVVATEATHGMQEALARSLSHSTGSKLVLLDGKALDSIRAKALSEGIPKDRLTSRRVTSALMEYARDDGSPFVVFLKDRGSAVFKSRAICQRITEELKSESSRMLFMLSTASDPSLTGNSSEGSGDDASAQQTIPQAGVFRTPLQWPPPHGMPPGHAKSSMQDGAPKKNFIFLQQTPPNSRGGPGDVGNFLSGRPPNRAGRGNRPGGRSPSGSDGTGLPEANTSSFGGAGSNGPPIPPQIIEQLLREAMKNMSERAEDAHNNNGKDAEDSGGRGGAGGDVPPGLLEALGEALNDDEFKNTLEQIGKQLGKDIHQSFSIMFSTTRPGSSDEDQGAQDGASLPGVGNRGDSNPWGASTDGHPNKGIDSGNNWQSSSSLSWLTNLRKGIMSGDEDQSVDHGEEAEGTDGDSSSRHGRDGNNDADGDDVASGARARKSDMRRGVDLTPSSSEVRTFVGLFTDITVNPPQEAILRQHWDTWVKEDAGKHSTRHNRHALTTALRRNSLACPDLKKLDPLLARHRLTEGETGQVVLSALKVELSKSEPLRSDSSQTSLEDKGLHPQEGASNAAAVTSPSPRRTSKGRLVISRQSMETAFAAVCKAYVPRPGHPMSRTREEVTALAQNDRHEQALVTNVILPKDIGVTYDMIGGLSGAKELLRECITYPLRFPHLYSEGIAKEAVKGVLLFGPPGTGKTMLAKAVATEGGATFLSVDASVIENKWLGESEKNARAVFTLARRLAPCVIFIDEVDSVLSSREKYDDTTHGTLTSVKTTLMQEWDGLRTGGDRVVVIASTNRPFDLDEAVLRRLPRRILVDLPDAETREEILRVSMAQNRVDASVNFTAITAELEGFTGSDIKEVCREAVVRIAHEKAHELDRAGGGMGEEIDLTAQLRPVTMNDFWEARKKLTASVSDKGRELARVWEWNEEYGEVKRKRPDASSHHLSMYL